MTFVRTLLTNHPLVNILFTVVLVMAATPLLVCVVRVLFPV